LAKTKGVINFRQAKCLQENEHGKK